MNSANNEVTDLLVEWSNGSKEALDRLAPLVYDELRRLASYYMQHQQSGHTLQATALVNEAFLRLIDIKNVRWKDRAHFFAVAAKAMRHILIDHARGRQRQKRGGGARTVSLDETATIDEEQADQMVELDDALKSLAAIDQRKGQIVELRFFGGLSLDETAEVLGISSPTVQREWRLAKAWIYRQLNG
ncbi:MAG TPA: sigma-70 family RNA polymerase sigma factor [Blastocatellia bacterium]|nr:sigma-70 family RNA polymerase sigma factor [Blastocatellia bacterium]